MPPWGRALILWWTFAALSLLAGPARLAARAPNLNRSSDAASWPLPPAAGGDKVAIFGVDAGDWREIDRLVASHQLPAFARLEQVASRGVLCADPPLLSPIIWTTIATGRKPEDHGVLDFMVDLPGGGRAPVNGGARRVKALWEIWSEAGRRVAVTGWWATWPADPVRGAMVSDRLATPHFELDWPDKGLVYPASLLPRVTRLVVRPGSLDQAALSRLIPVSREEFARAEAAQRSSAGQLYRDRIAHFRAAVAATRTYRQVSTELARSERPDLWAAYYEIVDTASHLFSSDRARRDRAVASAYREVDEALDDAARALDPQTLLVVVSDHGFQPPDAGVREDPADLTAGATAWHRPYGIIAVTTAGQLAGPTPAAERHPALGTVSPLDIAPTLLARASLPVANDMPGHVIPALAPAAAPARIASYGSHVLPDMPAPGDRAAATELARLRALGYISGATAVTSLARVNLGEILFREGNLPGAVRELEAVQRAEPLNERASLWLARAYAGLGRRDAAVALYDRLIQASRTTSFVVDPIVVLSATDLDVAAGRLDAARARLAKLPPSTARAPEAMVARGALAEAEGNREAAERSYRLALASSAADVESLRRLVDLLLGQHRAADALAVTSAAARAFSGSPQHLSLAGEAALASARYPDAERYFSAALAAAPGADSVRLDLARSRFLAGRADASLETLREAPASRDADTLRGAALSAMHRWEAAVASYERALGAGAPTTALLNALAVAQLEAGRSADAARSLERSLALDPNQPSARSLLARARQR